MRNFENWETQDLEITFGLKKNNKSKDLENWLNTTDISQCNFQF